MIHSYLQAIDAVDPFPKYGRVTKVAPGRIEASGPAIRLGGLCVIETDDGHLVGEVAAVECDRLVLVPLDGGASIELGALVQALQTDDVVPVGNDFAGRAIDALSRPIDGRPVIPALHQLSRAGQLPAPLARISPDRVLPTGIRAIDGLLTLGFGQRIGIFAASGVGKTSLIEQLALQTGVTRVVLCLVGERGREVQAIWSHLAARRDADRFTLVAATSDESAVMRARAVDTALALAEYWRDAGDDVLVIVDSITRYAMALREIGLAAGEPPTVRAYTPNVFSALPRVVERCGATEAGSITAIMTVLSETDDVDDPIVEVMKALLDGHIILSRTLAERGHFPAIDPCRSISRLASKLMSPDHAATARAAIAALGTYEEARLLIDSGMYQAGASAEIDEAISVRSALMPLLQQRQDETIAFDASLRTLSTAVVRRGGGRG